MSIEYLDFEPEDPELREALHTMGREITDEEYRLIIEDPLRERGVPKEHIDYLVEYSNQEDRRLGLNHPIYMGVING